MSVRTYVSNTSIDPAYMAKNHESEKSAGTLQGKVIF